MVSFTAPTSSSQANVRWYYCSGWDFSPWDWSHAPCRPLWNIEMHSLSSGTSEVMPGFFWHLFGASEMSLVSYQALWASRKVISCFWTSWEIDLLQCQEHYSVTHGNTVLLIVPAAPRTASSCLSSLENQGRDVYWAVGSLEEYWYHEVFVLLDFPLLFCRK